VRRNELTGTERFTRGTNSLSPLCILNLTGCERSILEVEQRIGERILYRNRGRPRSAA